MKIDYRVQHQSEKVSRIYDEVIYRAGSYDDILWQEEKIILADEISRLRKTNEHISYLDFGCGTGRILAYLEELVDKAAGVDIAAEMLDRARQVVKRAALIHADLTHEDVLQGQVFDLITAFRVLLNSESQLREEIMAVLARKMRNQNSLFIWNAHGNFWSHRLFTKIWLRLRGKHLSVMTRREAVALVERHGLYIERWYGFGIIPKIFYRILGSAVAHRIDKILSHIPGAQYVSYDLIFVCKKIQ